MEAGLPADADHSLVCEPVHEPGAGASTWKGHALLLRARRSDFRFPQPMPPGNPPCKVGGSVWRTSEVKNNRMRFPTMIMSWCIDRVWRGRRGQGVGEGVRPGARSKPAGPADEQGLGCRRRPRGAVSESADHRIERPDRGVTVESTSDYWRIWFYLLEAAGVGRCSWSTPAM